MSNKIRIAVFASGAGSNAAQLIAFFNRPDKPIEVSLAVCNKAGAGVLQIAAQAGIPSLLVNKEKFFSSSSYLAELTMAGIDFILLAGFLWKVPDSIIKAYPGRILNIHPALLPKYGGKGMYGHFVHEAVIAAKEPESGITIHVVDEHYDHGHTVFQAVCPVLPHDTADTLAQRIHALEHRHYPQVAEQFILQAMKK